MKLLKAGLRDARDVFEGDDHETGLREKERRRGDGRNGDGDHKHSGRRGVYLLELQAEARWIQSRMNRAFVQFIQGFLERQVETVAPGCYGSGVSE